MGAGVPRPCSAKRANASTSPGTPARIIIAPMPRVSSRPRNGGRSCQPVIDHGTSPASVHGATTKKTAEPRTAMVRCTAVPDTRCEVIPTSPSWFPVVIRVPTGNHEGEVGMTSQRVSGTAVQRTIAVLGSAVFFVVAPCTLAGLVPWSITGWQLRPPFLGLELTRGIGAIMILAGVPGLVDAFARFALQGLGTPAPIAPTRNLVVTGLYRYVRNPIYVAVVAIILGQAVLMGDWRLIVYGALLWLAFHVFVVAYEEPTLERTFGKE